METRRGWCLSKLPTETMDSSQASRSAINSPDPAVTNNRFSPLASPDDPLVSEETQIDWLWKTCHGLTGYIREGAYSRTGGILNIRYLHCDSMKHKVILYWITMNMPYPVPYPVWKCLPYGSTHSPQYLDKRQWRKKWKHSRKKLLILWSSRANQGTKDRRLITARTSCQLSFKIRSWINWDADFNGTSSLRSNYKDFGPL